MTERPKYHDEQCVDRILIDEKTTKKEKPKEVYHKRAEKPKSTGVTLTKQDQIDGARIEKKVIKVGKRDVHEVKTIPEELRRMEERLLTETEKVCL